MKIEPFLELPDAVRGHAVEIADAPMSLPSRGPARRTAEPADATVDPRRMSPRQFAAWAHELYIEGLMRWHDYRVAGFPSELHPSFDVTIGALTGEKAAPDQPRDMLLEWERRHAFERRHHGRDSSAAARCGRIVELLRWEADGRVSPPPTAPVETR